MFSSWLCRGIKNDILNDIVTSRWLLYIFFFFFFYQNKVPWGPLEGLWLTYNSMFCFKANEVGKCFLRTRNASGFLCLLDLRETHSVFWWEDMTQTLLFFLEKILQQIFAVEAVSHSGYKTGFVADTFTALYDLLMICLLVWWTLLHSRFITAATGNDG